MAITANVTILESAANLPSGYIIPSLPVIAPDADGEYSTDISVTKADPVSATQGLDNVLAEIKTLFETTEAINRALNPADTVNANLTVRSIQRLNTQGTENGGIFITGTEVFRCYVTFEYEKV